MIGGVLSAEYLATHLSKKDKEEIKHKALEQLKAMQHMQNMQTPHLSQPGDHHIIGTHHETHTQPMPHMTQPRIGVVVMPHHEVPHHEMPHHEMPHHEMPHQ